MVFEEYQIEGIPIEYDEVSKSLRLVDDDIGNEALEMLINYIKDFEPLNEVEKIDLGKSENLTELPESIGELPSLRELYIKSPITSLPDSLYEMETLETLSIIGGRLDELKDMRHMTALRYLRLGTPDPEYEQSLRYLPETAFPNRLLILDIQGLEIDENESYLINNTNPNNTTVYVYNSPFEELENEDPMLENIHLIVREETENVPGFPTFLNNGLQVDDVSPIGNDDASPQGASENDVMEPAQPSISLSSDGSQSNAEDVEVDELPEIVDFTSLDTLKEIMKSYKRRALPDKTYAETHPSGGVPIIFNTTRENMFSSVIKELNIRNNFENLLLEEKVNFRIDAGVDMGGVKREVYTKLANELARFTKINLKEDMNITPETECDEARRTLVNDYKQLIEDINVRQIINLSYDTAKVRTKYPESLETTIEEELQKIKVPIGIRILQTSFTKLLHILYETKNLGYRANISMKELFAIVEQAEYDFTRDINPDLYKLICMALFEMTEEHADYFLELEDAKKAVIWMYISALDDANYVANFKQQYAADKGKAFYFGRMGLPESIRPEESEEDEDDMTVIEQYKEYSERYVYNGVLDIDEIIHNIFATTDLFMLYYILNPEVELSPEQIEGFITNNLRFDTFTTSYVPEGYIPLKQETKTKVLNMIRDYKTGLSEAKIQEIQAIFPTQDDFLKKLFFFWSGSPIINTNKMYAITRTNTDRPYLFNSHTCFYWLELNERTVDGKSQDEFMDAIIASISGEGGFNLAGGRRRRFKKTQKKKGKKAKKGKRFARTIKK